MLRQPRIRTTVNLSLDCWEWARANIRNLSVFVDEAIKYKMTEVVYKMITCVCGSEFSDKLVERTGACPSCGRKIYL